MSNEKITVEVNLGNLSEDEREQFQALIERANMPPQKKWWEGTEFDIHSNDRFYTVAHDSSVCTLTNRNWATDKEAISFGNACKDRSYMEQRAKDIRRANLIANFAHVVNGVWRVDWSSDIQPKYYICFSNILNQWETPATFRAQLLGVVYFRTRELAQRCIDEIILPFERGEL